MAIHDDSARCRANMHARCENTWQGQPCACACHATPSEDTAAPAEPETPSVTSKTPTPDLPGCSTYLLSCGHGFVGASWLGFIGDSRRCLSCEEPPAPIARLSATCGAPKRRRAGNKITNQMPLLPECQPGALVAFDGTVYTQPELC